MIYKNVTDLIGNTPMLEISPEVHGLKNVNVYAKLEMMNPFGSVKDRTAFGLIRDHLDDIKNNGATVIESSSGNTAKALGVLCSVNNIPLEIYTNRIKVPESRDILRTIGVDVHQLPGRSECPDPDDPDDPIRVIERKIAQKDSNYFHTSQYTNIENPKIHDENTGQEISDDLGKVDYFFGTLGTTGSSRGIINNLIRKNNQLKRIGIIAKKGHAIPGIRNRDEMFEVGLYDKELYDDIVDVDSDSAVDSMLDLIRRSGVLGGPTSGACYRGMIDYLQKIDNQIEKKVNAVFVVCDRFEWYLSYIKKHRPDLFDQQSQRDNIWSLDESVFKSAKEITVENAMNWIDNKDPLIVDLRGNLAYRNAKIKKSINIADSIFEDVIDGAMPFSPDRKVLLVCPTGEKSQRFSAYLCKKGLDVYSLKGGLFAWRGHGLPLERTKSIK